MTTMKLEPCPFCGGEREIVREVTEALTVWYFGRCLDCGATGSVAIIKTWFNNAGISTLGGITPYHVEGNEPDDGNTELAIAAWNRRAPLAGKKGRA